MNTIKSIANYVINTPAVGDLSLKTPVTLLFCAFLAACSTPQAPATKAVYDFGAKLSSPAPSFTVSSTASSNSSSVRATVLQLQDIEATGGLDSTALLYRLAYADAQQLRLYATARWSVPPAQLLRSRLLDALAAQGAVVGSEQAAPWSLRVELDEFSQIFQSVDASQGVLRLRASLFQGQQLAAQTTLVTRAAAPSQDAAGGVKALTTASDEAVAKLAAWVQAQVK
jgi:cholesterol transport system auxiliary component